MAEYDGRGRSRGADPLAEFDAFRARRAAEQEANGSYEATAPVYTYGSADGGDGDDEYGYGFPDPGAAEPTRLVAGGGHKQPPGGRGKLRSTAVLLSVALFAVGLAAGVYAVTRSSNTRSTAASPTTGRSASPSTSAGAPTTADANGAGTAPGMGSTMAASPDMSMGMSPGMDPMGGPAPDMAQMGMAGPHGTPAQLTVLDVANDSFTALTVHGAAVKIRITGQTQFGAPGQPFSPADLVPGTQVLARVKRASDGQFVATQITGMGGMDQPPVGMNQPSMQMMSPSGDDSGDD
ncbi:MAG TPA: hypothetical protein VFU73_08680 [Actinocrinis sp.]|nr:hypothetical protein [Actinocrinis sp.]